MVEKLEETAPQKFSKLICSALETTKVVIYDLALQTTSTPQKTIRAVSGATSIVEQVPNSRNFLIAITGKGSCSAEVVDTATGRKIFDFGKMSGSIEEIAYNTSRGLMAFNSITNEIAYHLVSAGDLMVLRKAKWKPEHKKEIQSLDFNPEGSRIVSFDLKSTCLVSEIDTSNTILTVNDFDTALPWSKNKCRWNPVAANCKIALKYNQNKLSMLDVIKHKAVNKTPVFLDQTTSFNYGEDCHWIDWCKDGNLLASGGDQKQILIYDLRKGEIIKKISGIHTGSIKSLKWSPCSKMIATASSDNTFKLTQVDSGSIIYQSELTLGYRPSSVCFLQN